MSSHLTCIMAAAASGAAAIIGTVEASAADKKKTGDDRPNIILILTDQQTASAMSCAGNPYLSTPAMDALAADGVMLTRAYCPFPLSGPSRASLITGRMPVEIGASDNDVRPSEEAMMSSLGHRVSDAGYESLYAGKWHVTEVDLPDEGTGFERIAPMNDPDLVNNCRARLLAPREKPLFLVASFLDPHEICEYARRGTMPYGQIEQPSVADCPNLPANFMLSTYQPEAVELHRKAVPKFHPTYNYTQDDWRRYLYTYYRLVERVDIQIGRLTALLKEAGLYDNSVIIFFSDHGDGVAAHMWNQKWILTEEVVGVPLIVKAPKGKGLAGVRNDKALSNVGLDVFLTVCDYAGVQLDKDKYRGISLRKTVEKRDAALHAEVFVETILAGLGVRGWAVIGPRYKYVLYGYFENREQLYDLTADKGEMVNLAVDKRYSDMLQEMRRKLYEHAIATSDANLRKFLWPLVGTEGQ